MPPYDPTTHHRRSIRLAGYDYAEVGAYFVTIRACDADCPFGEIVDGEMVLSSAGAIVEAEWLRTPTVRSNVQLDAHVVMPDHIHGILVIAFQGGGARGVEPSVPPDPPQPVADGRVYPASAPRLRSPSQTVGAIVRGFKAVTTSRINSLQGAAGRPVWQRNYHEHIIRDDDDLNRIRQYVVENPVRWSERHAT